MGRLTRHYMSLLLNVRCRIRHFVLKPVAGVHFHYLLFVVTLPSAGQAQKSRLPAGKQKKVNSPGGMKKP